MLWVMQRWLHSYNFVKNVVCTFVLDPDIENGVIVHHEISLEAIHTPGALFFTMPAVFAIGFVTPVNLMNNKIAAGRIITTMSGHFVHAL